MSRRIKKNINLFLGMLLIFSMGINDLQVNAASVNQDYDAIIKNGTILDGSGEDRYEADIAIKDGYIVKIGDLSDERDRKSTRLNSSHVSISYAVFCLKKK